MSSAAAQVNQVDPNPKEKPSPSVGSLGSRVVEFLSNDTTIKAFMVAGTVLAVIGLAVLLTASHGVGLFFLLAAGASFAGAGLEKASDALKKRQIEQVASQQPSVKGDVPAPAGRPGSERRHSEPAAAQVERGSVENTEPAKRRTRREKRPKEEVKKMVQPSSPSEELTSRVFKEQEDSKPAPKLTLPEVQSSGEPLPAAPSCFRKFTRVVALTAAVALVVLALTSVDVSSAAGAALALAPQLARLGGAPPLVQPPIKPVQPSPLPSEMLRVPGYRPPGAKGQSGPNSHPQPVDAGRRSARVGRTPELKQYNWVKP